MDEELSRVTGAAERVGEMERQKRMLVEAFGTGLKLGIGWMPPQLRRQIYEALGLHITVGEAGGMHDEARVDEATVRYSREVERYARALREADERLRRKDAENPAGGYEATVHDPEGNPATLHITAHQERLERAERELARVRRELAASPGETDTVMDEIAGYIGKIKYEVSIRLFSGVGRCSVSLSLGETPGGAGVGRKDTAFDLSTLGSNRPDPV